jgi:hypothetical protein
MDAASIIPTFLHRESLHEFFSQATPAQRLQAREHVKKFIAAEREKRDKEIAAAEAAVSTARSAVAEAKGAVARAEAVEHDQIARINRARQAFDTTAGVLEHRLDDYDPTHRNAAEVAI